MEEPDFKFSFPDARYLPDKITPKEILSVFDNNNSNTEPQRQYAGICYYIIGFGSKKRFLELFLNYDDDRYNFLAAKVADENAIITGYCQRK